MNLNPVPFLGWRNALWLGLFLVWLSDITPARAQSADEVTTGFLYNFARFVEWPSKVFAENSSPFVIGFIGRPALADTFARIVTGRNVNGRDFAIKRLDGSAGVENCQIVYVGDASQTTAVLAALKNKPVLVVGEGDDFLTAGGMVAFKKDGARLVFDLNVSALKACQLNPDPKMEKAARALKP